MELDAHDTNHDSLLVQPLDRRVYLPPLHRIFPSKHPIRWHKVRKYASPLNQAIQFLTTPPPVFNSESNYGWELGADSLEYNVKCRVFERFTKEDFISTVSLVIPAKTRSRRVSGRSTSPEAEAPRDNEPVASEQSLAEQQKLLLRLGPLPPLNPFLVYYQIAGYSNHQLLAFAQQYKRDREEDDAQERARKRRRTVFNPQTVDGQYAAFMTASPQVSQGLRDLRVETPPPASQPPESSDDTGSSRSAKRQKLESKFGLSPVEWQSFNELEAAWEMTDPDDVKALKAKKKYLVAGLYSAHYKTMVAESAAEATIGNLNGAPAKESESATPTGVCSLAIHTPGLNRKVPESFSFPLPRNFGEVILTTEKSFGIPLDIAMVVEKKGGSRLLHIKNREPPLFQKIGRNIFVDRKPRKVVEVAVCRCDLPDDGSPACGEHCLNRCMFIECNPDHCPCGAACTNQSFQTKDFVNKLQVVWTGGRGHGLVTNIDIPAGKLVVEYCGEIISAKTYAERMERDYMDSHNFYCMAYGDNEIIDAARKGTDARFVNHSCEPNCRIEKWFVNGEYCIGLFAEHDVPAGTELTYDYRFQPIVEGPMKACLCGAPRCRGFLGNNKKHREEIREEEHLKESKRSKSQAKGAQTRSTKTASDRAYWIRKHAREKLISQAKRVIKHKDTYLAARPFLIRNLLSRVRVENLAENVGIPGAPVVASRPKRAAAMNASNNIPNRCNGGDVEQKPVEKATKRFALTAKTLTDEMIQGRAKRRNRSIETIVEDLNAAQQGLCCQW
ncbi:histone-lysine N-methyltransferase [Synchytrium endobioticum]|uniref:Histone-lysine N-methyltransferase n=1 Tax=Synchytrium endobioticum TaxID=286115 RepID=A0A507CZ28_9FUNG|nr:histone-lysine N-methyltransferase [Synchytrium endobioticum]TPX44414.1 histone-lysine N-methyltransferase [Synchytrium endobioticum]